jgi:hypothetical protein
LDFRYLRNEEEICRFLLSAQEENELVYTFYTTAIYTGMRAGEIAALPKAVESIKSAKGDVSALSKAIF